MFILISFMLGFVHNVSVTTTASKPPQVLRVCSAISYQTTDGTYFSFEETEVYSLATAKELCNSTSKL